MKKIETIILGLICAFIAGGCSDFLEGKSQDEVLVRTVEDYDELLLAYMLTEDKLFDMYEFLDDDMQIDENNAFDFGVNNNVQTGYGCFTWQPDMWEMENKRSDGYINIYSQIMGINAVLDGIDDAEGAREKKDRVKAEALGVRAYLYFMLVNLYGEPYNYNKEALGVVLKLSAGMVENGINRNSVEDVYTQLVKDLKESADLFAKYPKQRGNYRINGTAVNILLSRVYLHMDQWEEAIGAATKAIETAEGLTNYLETPEGSDFWMTTYNNSEVEWLFGKSELYLVNGFRPSDGLLLAYDTKDRRPAFWFVNDGAGGSWDIRKRRAVNNGTGPRNTIRISEAYLNRAEAYMLSENVNIDGALADWNELRRHRIEEYQDERITDPVRLLEEIRLERRRELCFELHRWFDLRRYGMSSISHDYKLKEEDPWLVYTLKEKDPLYTLPLPMSVFEHNLSLKQNASALEPKRSGKNK